MSFAVHDASRQDALVAARVEIAGTWWARFKGLLGRASIASDEGLHIVPCNSIHMFFMRFPIDVAFLDEGGKVVKAVHAIKPWRATRMYLNAHSALELSPGALERAGVQEGDLLRFDPAS